MLAATTGRRFSFFRRFDIHRPGEPVYLRRYYLVSTPWFGIYLHAIRLPDPDRDPHDHPWTFASLVLWGGYGEELHLGEGVQRARRYWRRLTLHRMRAEQAHRINYVLPNTWSLVFVGRRRREWGFHTPRGWTPWRVYLDAVTAKEAPCSDFRSPA